MLSDYITGLFNSLLAFSMDYVGYRCRIMCRIIWRREDNRQTARVTGLETSETKKKKSNILGTQEYKNRGDYSADVTKVSETYISKCETRGIEEEHMETLGRVVRHAVEIYSLMMMMEVVMIMIVVMMMMMMSGLSFCYTRGRLR